MFENIKGKVSLVTGSASGIGRHIAEKLAEYGSNIVISDLNLERSIEVAKEIEDKYKIKTYAVKMDVTNELEVNSCIDSVVEKFGKIDVLVNNAGIQVISPLVDFDTNKWKQIFDIQVNGSFYTTRAVMNKMIKLKNGGRIIIIGSVHSFEASKFKSAYVSAKHALHGLVKSIAKEGAEHNISANLVAPGFVKTPLVEKQIPQQAIEFGISEKEVVENVMLGETVDKEFTTLDDVSDVVLFFAAYKSKALTGQSLVVSHGWCMR